MNNEPTPKRLCVSKILDDQTFKTKQRCPNKSEICNIFDGYCDVCGKDKDVYVNPSILEYDSDDNDEDKEYEDDNVDDSDDNDEDKEYEDDNVDDSDDSGDNGDDEDDNGGDNDVDDNNDE